MLYFDKYFGPVKIREWSFGLKKAIGTNQKVIEYIKQRLIAFFMPVQKNTLFN